MKSPVMMKMVRTRPGLVIVAMLIALLASAVGPAVCAPHDPAYRTAVSIVGEDFRINGKPTYQGRMWRGHKVEGLLLNSRMVQATFDDTNPSTVGKWAYPDTGKWDADRNTNEFIREMPAWRKHGLLAVTINFQGGSPTGYLNGLPWTNSAFEADGSLRADYASRVDRVIKCADELGMVVIVGYFYFGQDEKLKDDAAVGHATDVATNWLLDKGYTNVLVEIANETGPSYHHAILKPDRIHELIERVALTHRGSRRLLVGTSYGGGWIPGEEVTRVSDFVLIHGNGVSDPATITRMIQQTRALGTFTPKPILINEDDHFDFDKPVNNFAAALAEHVSWGYFDYRKGGEGYDDGYQSVPVNWAISSPRKKAFFDFLADVTGSQHSLSPN